MAVMVVVVMVVVIVVVVVTALHPLGVLLPVCLHAVHHGQPVGDLLARRVQHILHPQLALAAVPDEHIRPAHGDHVQRRGLEAVRFPPGGYQQHRVHRVAADLPHEIVVGEQGAYHLQPPIVFRVHPPPAAGRRQQQHRRQQRRRKSPHAPHLLAHKSYQYTTSIGKREVGAFVEAGKRALHCVDGAPSVPLASGLCRAGPACPAENAFPGGTHGSRPTRGTDSHTSDIGHWFGMTARPR